MRLSGLFAPIPTPFTERDTLDEAGLARNLAHWMATPLDGVVVLGSNGESVALDDDEADRAIAVSRSVVPSGRLLVAGTGRESTREAIQATRRAAAAGVDAVLVRTPSFFKPQMTTEVFVRHYTAVADASPVPVLLYNVAMFTGVNLPPDAVERLATHPNVAGIKESGGDVAQLAEFVARTPPDFAVLAGSASTFLPALAVGCSGAVLALAALVPGLCSHLRSLMQGERLEDARSLQRRLAPLGRLVGATGGVPALKAAIDLIGLTGGRPRPPLLPPPPSLVDALRVELAALGALPVRA